MSGSREKRHRCDTCGKMLLSRSQLDIHMRIHTGERPYECDECDKGFAESSALTKHKRTHTGEKPFECDQCDKAFAHQGNLTRHKRTHTGEKPYECHECDKAFADSSQLTTHKRTHTGERPYECDECDKGFAESSALTKHKHNHTGEKPYKCDQCDKAFSQSSHLTTHKRTHTGDKPYKCNECDKGFARSGDLTIHKRIHTGEKPFKCEQCEKHFRTANALALHKRHHTGEKPYQCEFCEKKFAQSGSLKAHERTHTGEKPYHCDQCGARFSQSHCLKYHKRNACRMGTVGVVRARRQGTRRMPYARKEQLPTRRNGATNKPNIIIVTEANMHEVEAEVLRELYTPAPGHHLLSEVKKEEETDDDADVEGLYTPPPRSQMEDMKCESEEEEYTFCASPDSPRLNMTTLTPRHQTNDDWPQQPSKRFVPSQPFEAHDVAGTKGTHDMISRPSEAPIANTSPYYAAAACVPLTSFSQNVDSTGTAPPHSYHQWSEHQTMSPHPPPAFSPYFRTPAVAAGFSSMTDMANPMNRPHVALQPMTAPRAPSAMPLAPRRGTPRDLVTPFTSERDFSAAGNGDIAFGNTATGGWNQATDGNAYRCLECSFIAAIYDMLCGHHYACHRTNNLTDL